MYHVCKGNCGNNRYLYSTVRLICSLILPVQNTYLYTNNWWRSTTIWYYTINNIPMDRIVDFWIFQTRLNLSTTLKMYNYGVYLHFSVYSIYYIVATTVYRRWRVLNGITKTVILIDIWYQDKNSNPFRCTKKFNNIHSGRPYIFSSSIIS